MGGANTDEGISEVSKLYNRVSIVFITKIYGGNDKARNLESGENEKEAKKTGNENHHNQVRERKRGKKIQSE